MNKLNRYRLTIYESLEATAKILEEEVQRGIDIAENEKLLIIKRFVERESNA